MNIQKRKLNAPELQDENKKSKKDFFEQARIYYENLEKIAKKFGNKEVHQNLNNLKETFFFLRDNNNESETMFIGFFGSPGSGKSRRINELLGDKLLTTIPVLESKGEGCTKYPTICFFKDIEFYQLFFIKDKNETLFKAFKNFYEVRKELDNIMNRENEIDYIKIIVPKKSLNKSNSFLFDKNIALIDTIGVPDNNIPNAHMLNAKIIMNEELDTSFILQNSSRGNITKEYINDLFESDIFKLKKYSDKLTLILPKIVSIFHKFENNETQEKQEIIESFKVSNKGKFINVILDFLNIRAEKEPL